MAPRTVYASLADGLSPLSQWDASLADMGSLGVIPCTASGTNAIALTPIASVFAPNVTVPHPLQLFSFLATATSTGAVTIQVGSSGALKYYPDGVTQAGAGSVQSGLAYFVMYNSALNGGAGGFASVSSSTSSATVDQNITSAGPVTVSNNSSVVRVNQTIGAAMTLNLPAAANKTCAVLIADWKGDAGTNNITITPNGAEKIQGLSSWTISADNGSVFLRPIAGVGYAL